MSQLPVAPMILMIITSRVSSVLATIAGPAYLLLAFVAVQANDAGSPEPDPVPESTGSIQGCVILEGEKVGQYANVILQEVGQGRICDERGEFHFDKLLPGLYTLSVRLIGHHVLETEQLLLRGGEQKCLDFWLERDRRNPGPELSPCPPPDTLLAIVPRVLQIRSEELGDLLAFGAAHDSVRLAIGPDREYGTVVKLYISCFGNDRYMSGTTHMRTAQDRIEFRCPQLMFMTSALRDSLVGVTTEVACELSIVATDEMRSHDRHIPTGWDPERGEVLYRRRLARILHFDGAEDSLLWRVSTPSP